MTRLPAGFREPHARVQGKTITSARSMSLIFMRLPVVAEFVAMRRREQVLARRADDKSRPWTWLEHYIICVWGRVQTHLLHCDFQWSTPEEVSLSSGLFSISSMCEKIPLGYWKKKKKMLWTNAVFTLCLCSSSWVFYSTRYKSVYFEWGIQRAATLHTSSSAYPHPSFRRSRHQWSQSLANSRSWWYWSLL